MRIPFATDELRDPFFSTAWKALQVVAVFVAFFPTLSFDACRHEATFRMQQVSFRNQTAAVPSIQVPSRCFWMASTDSAAYSW